MKILCIGQSAYDITLPISGYPKENKKYKINQQVECGGGSANNSAYLLAKWGNATYLASTIGKDLYGKRIKDELISVGVNIDYFEELDIGTTISYIINNVENGSRTILTQKNPAMHFTNLADIDLKPDVILVDGNNYEMALKILKKNKDAIKIIDAGSFKTTNIDLCKECDYIVCSNDFAKEYTKINFSYDNIDQIKEVYDLIQKDFTGQLVITLESFGSFTKIDNAYHLVPSIKVECVDSTGAGDIYHGAFTHFIAHHYPLLDTMRLANIAGALSVSKIGSKESQPNLAEVINYDKL